MTPTAPTPPKLDARIVIERIRVVVTPRGRQATELSPPTFHELTPRRGRP